MPLPKIVTPVYEIELPSTGKPIKFRPFLVREEKVLVMAMETEDTQHISEAVKNVLKSCILTKGIKVETLPTFDIEFIFLNVRAMSVGDDIEVNIICPDDKETEIPVTINVSDIKVQKDPKHTNKVQIDENIILQMKYPSLDEFIKNNFDIANSSNIEQTFELIASCIDSICTEEEVISATDVTKDEILDFLDQMNTQQFKKVEEFFETMPKLKHEIEVENPETKVKSKVIIEGLASFFA
jgi:hypothetical protein